MILLFKTEYCQDLQEAHVELWTVFIQLNTFGNLSEFLKVSASHQEKLNTVEGLQEQVFIIIILQDRDKQSVTLFVHTINPALLVLQKLGENSIRITKSCLVFNTIWLFKH